MYPTFQNVCPLCGSLSQLQSSQVLTDFHSVENLILKISLSTEGSGVLGFCFDSRFRHFHCVLLSVWLSQGYGHTPLPNAMEFVITVLGTKVERRICKDFHFPFVSKLRPFYVAF